MTLTLKTAVHVSDTAYDRLIQQAYQLGFVRGAGPNDKPRGLSAFISTLPSYDWYEHRPEYLRETGQWHSGQEPLKERCLHLSPNVVADLGRIALSFHIFPYKSQAPVVNGFRKEATIPVLYPVGHTPPGRTSVKALAGPVLEAIGLGYLAATDALRHAPPNLYQGPTRRDATRRRVAARAMSDALLA